MQAIDSRQIVVSFYRFISLTELEDLRRKIHSVIEANGLLGTVILAQEGINGTLAGDDESALHQTIDGIEELLNTQLQLRNVSYAHKEQPVFFRLKVVVRREIASFGIPYEGDASAAKQLTPHEWQSILDDPDVLVLDVRNKYETDIGRFAGAVLPNTDNFRDLKRFVQTNLMSQRDKKLAIYCTGGIRCEKTATWFSQSGFDDVVQLNGGVLSYLREIKPPESRWIGDCFVFDKRVAVGLDLEPNSYTQCYACRHPLSKIDRESSYYDPGVQCRYCATEKSDSDRRRYRERVRQEDLAGRRDSRHVGAVVVK